MGRFRFVTQSTHLFTSHTAMIECNQVAEDRLRLAEKYSTGWCGIANSPYAELPVHSAIAGFPQISDHSTHNLQPGQAVSHMKK